MNSGTNQTGSGLRKSLGLIIYHFTGRILLAYLRFRYRELTREARPLSIYLETDILPLLRGERIGTLNLRVTNDGGETQLVGTATGQHFTFPGTGTLARQFHDLGLREIRLDTQLEYGQILESLLLLRYTYPARSDALSLEEDYHGWRRRKLASSMRSSAGLHRACATMRLDSTGSTYAVEYTYCELFWSRIVRSYVARQPLIHDHRALFRIAPAIAVAAFLVLVVPVVFVFRDPTVAAEIWVVLAAIVAIAFWCFTMAIASTLYTREHYENLIKDYLRQIRSAARFPEANPNPVMEINLDGSILYTNPAAITLLRTCDFAETDKYRVLPKEYRSLVRQALDTARTITVSGVVEPDRTFLYTFSPFPEARSVIVTASDITYLKRIEDELCEKNDELAAKNEALEHAYSEASRELDEIADIQAAFLPECLPSVPGLELAAFRITAQKAGGDYYDVFPLADGRWGFLIADVCGHGAPASVLMAITHSLARRFHAETRHFTPGEFLTFLNRELVLGYTERRCTFVTAFYCIYNPDNRQLTYSSAGHNPPRLRLDSKIPLVELCQAQSFPLGITKDVDFENAEALLKEKGLLVLYTDGVTEAMNANRETFSTTRLDRILSQCDGGATNTLAAIQIELDLFTNGQPLSDDRTMILAHAL